MSSKKGQRQSYKLGNGEYLVSFSKKKKSQILRQVYQASKKFANFTKLVEQRYINGFINIHRIMNKEPYKLCKWKVKLRRPNY